MIDSINLKQRPITRYELPSSGNSLLGYIVRRMHKTSLLNPLPEMLNNEAYAEALAQLALYTIGAAASFGPAYY